MLSRATLAYFCAPPDHYWEWEDEATVWAQGDQPACAVWAEGRSTILFLGELLPLLNALVPEGLPPLGAILLVVAAASDNWDASAVRERIFNAAKTATGREASPNVVNSWRHVAKRLDAIHALPKDLRENGPSRAALLKMIFEGAFNRLPSSLSENILGEFKEAPYLLPFQERAPDVNGIARILRDLSVLDKAFANLSLVTLEQRLRTGVDVESLNPVDLPEGVENVPGIPEVSEDLIQALENEGDELAQIAGVARRLAAILHVPKPMSEVEDLPLGGVSDITNRGDPSQLLMTELAWDDLTFAVRISQGEALYMRRESPPSDPPPQRVILLDTGIFMWGKPRLFALGAALALLRQKGADARIFALVKEAFVPIGLASVAEVREHLTRLEPSPDPRLALSSFVETHCDALFAKGQGELFVVSHPCALESVVMTETWTSLTTRVPLHSLRVDREGQFVLARHNLAGERILVKGKMELDRLLGDGHAAQSLTAEAGRLPHFYQQSCWPLYHPVVPEADQTCKVKTGGYVGISAAGCVCYWNGESVAARVLHPTAPSQNLTAIALDPEEDDRVILIFRGLTPELFHVMVVSLSGRSRSTVFPVKDNRRVLNGALIQSGALVLHFLQGRSQAVCLRDGSTLATVSRTFEDRRQGSPWFDGERFHLEKSGPTGPLNSQKAKVSGLGLRKRRIAKLAQAGFGIHGGLVIQKELGRMYELEMEGKAVLRWAANAGASAVFRPLVPMVIPEWPDHGLSQAEFPDGRRVIYDSRGVIHVVEDGEQGNELSVVLVEGETTAWKKSGFYYGDPQLLWGEGIGAKQGLTSVWQQLLRPVIKENSSKTQSIKVR